MSIARLDNEGFKWGAARILLIREFIALPLMPQLSLGGVLSE